VKQQPSSSPSERSDRPARLLVAKPGLDGHDRGAKVVARALRDGGFEVVYTGLHHTPEQIVSASVQEDVAGIGLSVLSGAHQEMFGEVIGLLRERGIDDVVVFGGGIIPDGDRQALEDMGVAAVFTPGTPTSAIVAWARETIGYA
jgi:methylmalonyl-CoA mutase C-terminal domain/subunit